MAIVNNKKPTVTELLELLNKPALIKWANKLGLKGIDVDEYRTEAMKKGSDLHNQINEFSKYGIPFENKELWDNYSKFISDKQVIDAEQNIECDLFIGRYDIKLKVNNDIVIADFKSSNRIYLENILQLVCYQIAFPDCKIAVVEIPSFKYKPLFIKDITPYKNIIEALVSIYNNKRLID